MTSPYVSELKLSHFRSHKTLTLQSDHRPIALWGPNGAGKTNILEAVSLLSPGRGLRRATSVSIMRQPEALGWRLAATMVSEDLSSDVEIKCDESGARQLRVDGKNAPQLALSKLARIIWLVPAQDRLWIEGAEGRRRFLDRMALSFYPDHAAASLTYEKAMRERNRLIKEGITDRAWYAALEAKMAEAAVSIATNRTQALSHIQLAQSRSNSAFPIADLTLEEVANSLTTETEFAEAFEDNRPRDIAAGRTLIGPHRTDLKGTYAAKNMPAHQCSTGEQKALLVSLVLANARALKARNNFAPIILLDEIAAHLDNDRRAALFDEICALETQAWMTGTGPELFIELGERAQSFELLEKEGQSEIKLH